MPRFGNILGALLVSHCGYKALFCKTVGSSRYPHFKEFTIANSMPNLEVTMNIASIVPAILSALDPCAKEKKTRSTDKIVLNQKGIRKGVFFHAEVTL